MSDVLRACTGKPRGESQPCPQIFHHEWDLCVKHCLCDNCSDSREANHFHRLRGWGHRGNEASACAAFILRMILMVARVLLPRAYKRVLWDASEAEANAFLKELDAEPMRPGGTPWPEFKLNIDARELCALEIVGGTTGAPKSTESYSSGQLSELGIVGVYKTADNYQLARGRACTL